MNWRKNRSLFKSASKGLIVLFISLNMFNYQILFSYIAGTLKSTWYNWTVPDTPDAACTLANPFFKSTEFRNNKCVSCESITKISRLYDTTFEEIDVNYIKRNSPVIITDAMMNWKTVAVDIFNITESYRRQSWIPDHKPCDLLTNFDLQTDFILDYLTIASNYLSNHWFIQWKNCDQRAVKIARNFYQQPYFVKYYLPAAKINWILISYQYETNKYHEINVEGRRFVQFMQLRGSFKVKFQPRQKCRNSCSIIIITLNESETLVINSDLWSLHYKPLTNDINAAIITENDLR
ncbi:uncharacterized protein LOC135832043 [Planococcus citri]|uniref:uncharacterized protein LOC135832043 n=1 Tax=Planococcus citri TaxID=170843 RepID=UPI0031F8A806